MNDLIRRQAAIDAIHNKMILVGSYLTDSSVGFEFAEDEINNLPSADVAPVVRCENCIHWSDSNQCARPELSGSRWHDTKYFDTYPDDFCSYGERRE